MNAITHITSRPNTGIVPPWLVIAENRNHGIVPPRLQLPGEKLPARDAVALLTR